MLHEVLIDPIGGSRNRLIVSGRLLLEFRELSGELRHQKVNAGPDDGKQKQIDNSNR